MPPLKLVMFKCRIFSARYLPRFSSGVAPTQMGLKWLSLGHRHWVLWSATLRARRQTRDCVLAGFSGTLQVDDRTGYNALIKPGGNCGPYKLAYCWARARRKHNKVHDRNGSPIASSALPNYTRSKSRLGGNRLDSTRPCSRHKPSL